MNFQFGFYTEITDFALKYRPEYKKDGYIRFFVCPDVHTFWFVRILEGYNESYEKEDGCYVLERNNIDNYYKGQKLTISKLKEIINDDDYSNWDCMEGHDLEDLIDNLDFAKDDIIDRKRP